VIGISESYAEEQVPGMVIAVEGDPFYFSEGDFGPKILKYFQRSLDPYLVSGVTTDQSSISEIMQAYRDATKEKTQEVIVWDDSRAQSLRVSFFGAEIQERQTFDSFLKFEHLEVQRTYYPLVPYYYDITQEGFALESLPSKDKKWFYDFVVGRTITSEKDPEPFDVDVEVLSGSGTVLQAWEYRECRLAEYFPYLDENLAKLKFVGDFISEIRDVSVFECSGFHVDFEAKSGESESVVPADYVPTFQDRAQKILVQFSGGELESEVSYFTFSKFVPIKDILFTPIKLPGFPVNEKPQFTLESLPSKDKQEYYDFIARYIDPVKEPEPFDVKVHLISGDGTVLQTWHYEECSGTNYVTFFLNNLLFYKFKQTMGSEIRDKSFFECNGIEFSTEQKLDEQITNQIKIPNDFDRAQTFVAHFEGPEISPQKTITTFTKFSPLTNEELQVLLPNAPFGGKPKFYFESLVSEDKQWLYELIGMYVNRGKIPEPFDVSTQVITGDATILQTWDYEDCHIIDYKSYLEDALVTRKFTKQFNSEIHDRTIFECKGFSLNSAQTEPEVKPEKPYDYVDFVPSDESRAQRFVLTLSGGELTAPQSYYTFAKFNPLIEEKSERTPARHQLSSVGFAVESLPSKDKEEYYQLLQEYINIGKEPEPFDATIEIVAGDGDILQTWEYRDCQLSDFDYFLQDNLLYFTMNGKKATSEIRDKSEFECIGFSVDFSKNKKNYSELPVHVPKYEDRAVMFLFHVSGGELEDTRSTAMISKFSSKDTVSDEIEQIISAGAIRNAITSEINESIKTENFGYPKFMGESLPNKFATTTYKTAEQYLNPGKDPEPFDIRVDVLTGDGMILYSGDYDDCSGVKYSAYLNDNIAMIKFHPSLKSEFRDRFEVECIGVDVLVMPQKDSGFSITSNLSTIKPAVQLDLGALPNEVVCKDDMSLMQRPPTNIAICVFDDHTKKLEQRGWLLAENQPTQISTKIQPVIPTDSERAQNIIVHFQGPDITPPKTLTTFSKFSPIESQNLPLLIPEHDFKGDAAFFYLESLPSHDKDWLYELLSRYINPGRIPEPTDVKIEIFSGDDTLLQTWDYNDCQRKNYELYLDESLLTYKFHEKWQSEFKDRIIFSCDGLSFEH
jgi:hypothetical protein